jgi:hypothetical protein
MINIDGLLSKCDVLNVNSRIVGTILSHIKFRSPRYTEDDYITQASVLVFW